MHIKWRIYFLTLVTYAAVHSLRTNWSAIKSDLTGPPFNYEVTFLGTIDMLLLFVIAIFMNILGPRVEIYGAKKCLIATLIALFVFNTLTGIFLNLNITSQWVYVIFFGFGVGVSSSTAWPSCLYMVSLYFDKRNGITLSAWNGTSQLGDFISLITFFVIVASNSWQPQSSFFLGSAYLLIMLVLVAVLIPNELNNHLHPHPHVQKKPDIQGVELQEENVPEQAKNEVVFPEGKHQSNIQSEEKKLECMSSGSEEPNLKESNNTQGEKVQMQSDVQQHKNVNLLTVWLLPGVALNVLAYGFVKSVNVFIISWMVYYLITLDMGSEAVLVTLLWSFGVFMGGIICGIINKQLRKIFFVFQLVAATVAFIFLESFHLKVYEVQIIIAILVCAIFVGGPFSLMSTAIPISLGNQQQVLQYQNGKAAIISLVQGYGLFFSGISLILMPAFGIGNINIVGASYCTIAALLLLGQIYRTRSVRSQATKQQKQIVAK